MGDFFISATGLKTLLDGANPPTILDVRKQPAFEESGEMLPGAKWRDPFEVERWASDLLKDSNFVVHCVHGHEVSQSAGATLRDLGFDARVLAGGFEAWRTAGGAVVPVGEAQCA